MRSYPNHHLIALFHGEELAVMPGLLAALCAIAAFLILRWLRGLTTTNVWVLPARVVLYLVGAVMSFIALMFLSIGIWAWIYYFKWKWETGL